jgi:CHAT domain-containing protein/Tfp pilus assembly protein PilF
MTREATLLRMSSGRAARRWGLVAIIVFLLWPMAVRAQTEDLPSLMQRITEFIREGRYSDAMPHARRLVAEAEKAAGKDHQITAMTLMTLADLHRLQGQFDEAEPVLNRALLIREHVLGTNHPEVATTLLSLAQLCLSRARYGEADRHLKRALDIRIGALGPEHPDVGMILITIARLRHQQGRLDEAEIKNRDALGLIEKALGPDHMYVSVALNNLAEIHRALGRLDDVEADLLRALHILESQFGPNSVAIAPMLNNLGELRRHEGRFAEAEAYFRREFEISERALGPEHPEIATTLGNIGTLFVRQGRPEDAEGLLRRALAIREKTFGAEHPDVATALNNLADALDQLDRPDEAEPLLRRSLTVREKNFGPDHASVAVALDNLATHFHKQARFAEAEPLARRALAIRERTLGAEHPLVTNSLNNLATTLDLLDRHDEAAAFLHRALSMREKTYGSDHPETAITLHNLASSYLDRRLWESAHQLFKRASAIWVSRQAGATARHGIRSEVSANIDPFLGLIIAAYELRQAATWRSRLELEAEAFAAAQWVTGSRAGAAISAMSARFAGRSDDLGDLVRKRQDLAEQVLAVDRSLFAAVLRPSQDRDAARETALREQAVKNIARLRDADSALARRFPDYAALTNPTPISIAAVQRLLRPDEALLVFVPVREATYAWLLTRTRHEWGRSAIGSKALKERIATLRCGLDATSWQGDSAEHCVNLSKISAHDALERANSLPFSTAIAAELYQLLIDPFAEAIKNKHLLIASSGALTSLPFGVLLAEQATGVSSADPDYRRLAWLGLRSPITVLPSVAALQGLRRVAKQSSATRTYLGVGNPLLEGQPNDPKHGEYFKIRATEALERQACPKRPSAHMMPAFPRARVNASRSSRGGYIDIEQVREWAPLPETADELCEVGRRLGVPESAILLGGRATETAIKALSQDGQLANYAILHFATHGALAGQAEELTEPGLVLTPPPKDTRDPDVLARDDGYLTASEIAALRLNADWVVLSACNTAGGTSETAEALSGLARAFFYAGARALLVSNWEVNSDAAVKLMTRAFAEMKAKPRIGRAEAFRLSMRHLVEKGSPAETHPSIWAPFVVVGEGAR